MTAPRKVVRLLREPCNLSDSGDDWEAVNDDTVVEQGPSHDGAPCVSVWHGPRPYSTGLVFEEDDDQTMYLNPERPAKGIPIYDTTPNAADPAHLLHMALALHRLTFREQGTPKNYMARCDGEWLDRIDVFGLPMPARATTQERVDRCVAHSKKEIVYRILHFGADWYIPPRLEGRDMDDDVRALFIVDQEEAQWQYDSRATAAVDGELEGDSSGSGDGGSERRSGPFVVVQWPYIDPAVRERRPGRQKWRQRHRRALHRLARGRGPKMQVYRWEDDLEEFGSWVGTQDRWFNSTYVVEPCSCDGGDGASCKAGEGALAHVLKVYRRLLLAGEGLEFVGDFGCAVDPGVKGNEHDPADIFLNFLHLFG